MGQQQYLEGSRRQIGLSQRLGSVNDGVVIFEKKTYYMNNNIKITLICVHERVLLAFLVRFQETFSDIVAQVVKNQHPKAQKWDLLLKMTP
jgi:hypothetical protein